MLATLRAQYLRVDRGGEQRRGVRGEPERPGHHPVGIGVPYQPGRRPVAPLAAVGVFGAGEPFGERHRQPAGGGAFRDGAQLVLIRRGSETGQRSDFAVGEAPIGETGGDLVGVSGRLCMRRRCCLLLRV